jgi:glucose/arabinose dehydrogenase
MNAAYRRRSSFWGRQVACAAVLAVLVWATSHAQGDTQPPTVTAQSPPTGATGVSTQTNVAVTFSEAISPTSLSFVLRTSGGAVVPSNVTYDGTASTAVLDPVDDLAGASTFTATVSGVRDLAGNLMAAPLVWSFTTATPSFQETVVFSGLINPTAIEFASDGRVFVAEKSGLIKVFTDLTDTTPSIFADLRTNVYNHWDRGLLSLALHPGFPTVPYVYVLYSYDADIGGTAPKWGTPGVSSDPCPTPPGADIDGCVISGRLSRLTASGDVMTGQEVVLLEDWFQQFPTHSVGTLMFGPDGALYTTAGEGAQLHWADWGQAGIPVNPAGDPPTPIGVMPTPPTAEGGALRSQDLRTSGDPVTLDGTLIRIDPETAAAPPDNPRISDPDPNGKRIIAYGLRKTSAGTPGKKSIGSWTRRTPSSKTSAGRATKARAVSPDTTRPI